MLIINSSEMLLKVCLQECITGWHTPKKLDTTFTALLRDNNNFKYSRTVHNIRKQLKRQEVHARIEMQGINVMKDQKANVDELFNKM